MSRPTRELLLALGCDLTNSIGEEVGSGWHDIVSRLVTDMFALGWDGDVHQVKEKFGGLRFYIGAGNSDLYTRVLAAENESVRTCEVCGGAGSPTSTRWIRTRCVEHQHRDPE